MKPPRIFAHHVTAVRGRLAQATHPDRWLGSQPRICTHRALNTPASACSTPNTSVDGPLGAATSSLLGAQFEQSQQAPALRRLGPSNMTMRRDVTATIRIRASGAVWVRGSTQAANSRYPERQRDRVRRAVWRRTVPPLRTRRDVYPILQRARGRVEQRAGALVGGPSHERGLAPSDASRASPAFPARPALGCAGGGGRHDSGAVRPR